MILLLVFGNLTSPSTDIGEQTLSCSGFEFLSCTVENNNGIEIPTASYLVWSCAGLDDHLISMMAPFLLDYPLRTSGV